MIHNFLRSNVLAVVWVVHMHHDPLFNDDGVNQFLQRLEGYFSFLHPGCHFLVERQKDDTLQVFSAFFETPSPLSWNRCKPFTASRPV